MASRAVYLAAAEILQLQRETGREECGVVIYDHLKREYIVRRCENRLALSHSSMPYCRGMRRCRANEIQSSDETLLGEYHSHPLEKNHSFSPPSGEDLYHLLFASFTGLLGKTKAKRKQNLWASCYGEIRAIFLGNPSSLLPKVSTHVPCQRGHSSHFPMNGANT